MAPSACPACGTPMPSSLTSCPSCGYAGLMTPAKGIFNPGPRLQKAGVAVILGGTLLARCGVQAISHADDVADVAGIVDDWGDTDDEPPGPPSEVSPRYDDPLYAAPDGSFTVLFPGTDQVVEDTSDSSDGTHELTLHQGEWHVRQIVLAAGADPGPDLELALLVDDLAARTDALVVTAAPTEVAGHPGTAIHLERGDRPIDAIVTGEAGTYYELWHTPSPPASADVSPLLAGFAA